MKRPTLAHAPADAHGRAGGPPREVEISPRAYKILHLYAPTDALKGCFLSELIKAAHDASTEDWREWMAVLLGEDYPLTLLGDVP
jgi:hypothetical protein